MLELSRSGIVTLSFVNLTAPSPHLDDERPRLNGEAGDPQVLHASSAFSKVVVRTVACLLI